MNFCGTIPHERRWRMLGFAMHCEMLASRLLNLKYKRTNEERSGEKNEQLQFFHLTNEEREEFLKFAGNLRWLVEDHKIINVDESDSFWEGYRKFEYVDYEIRRLFDRAKEDVYSVAALLEKAGNEETLTDEEIKTAMHWLSTMGSRAHARGDDGGCF